MKQKNIAVCIILTLFTCGIYGIVWFFNLTDETASLNEDPSFSGINAFLFTLLTCGIYNIYWSYKMGKELYEAKLKRNIPTTDQSVLYLILSLFGLGIVNYCLMQNDINELISK